MFTHDCSKSPFFGVVRQRNFMNIVKCRERPTYVRNSYRNNPLIILKGRRYDLKEHSLINPKLTFKLY